MLHETLYQGPRVQPRPLLEGDVDAARVGGPLALGALATAARADVWPAL